MVAMTGFSYAHRDTPVHSLDPRVKLLALAAFSIAAVALVPWSARAVLAAGLLGAYAAARARPLQALFAARLFLLLALAVVATHSFTGGRFTTAGALDGAGIAADFLLVVLAAELTLQTTPAGRVADVFHWLLRPVPGVNAGRVALMAGLALRHVVVLGDLYRRLSEAMTVRGIRLRRAPLRGIGILAASLIRETVLAAEQTTDALIARGYSDDRTPPAFAAGRGDAVGVVLVVALIAGASAVALLPGP
jgi:energy-coupling factor transporter transmembrane protein EcfT